MALSQDGYEFETPTHGRVVPTSRPNRIVRGQWFGVVGEANAVDSQKGQMLTCECWYEKASYTLLVDVMDDLRAQADTPLTGDLAVTGDFAHTFSDCTFAGVSRVITPPSKHAATTWWMTLELQWIKRV